MGVVVANAKQPSDKTGVEMFADKTVHQSFIHVNLSLDRRPSPSPSHISSDDVSPEVMVTDQQEAHHHL